MKTESYHEHQLEWVRERVLQAFRISSTYRTWLSDPSSRLNVCYSPSSKINGTHRQLHIKEKHFQRSTLPISLQAFEDKKVSQWVYHLPCEQQCWIRYAYTSDFTWEDEVSIVRSLWKIYSSKKQRIQQKTREKLKGLAYLCVQDYKYLKNRGKPKYKPAKIRELLSVKESNWRRDWLPRWQRMQSILAAIDTQALSTLLGNFENMQKH
ncbi:bacteriophage antitermination protein Q [Algicola sagamiensis]|uniref:bacteriophage antitermination protein Q n=1 Tax=Algicola sagamiensis TaxID=163869 RepID=UPI000380EFA4|nr:bacteriophage antitermination protein Q [Algicola sagamiensis]